MKLRGSLMMTWVVCGACAGPAAVRGGHAVLAESPSLASGAEGRQTQLIRRYRVAHCVDRSGASVASRYSEFAWRRPVATSGQGADAEPLLEVEFLPGAQGVDRLVVENSFALGAERVFQVVLSPAKRPALLMDVRLPMQGGAGRLALVRAWQQTESQERFRAYFSELASACRLEELPSPDTLETLGSKLSRRRRAEPQTG